MKRFYTLFLSLGLANAIFSQSLANTQWGVAGSGTLTFTSNTVTSWNPFDGAFDYSYVENGNTINTTFVQGFFCNVGDVAVYTFSINNNELTLTQVSNQCPIGIPSGPYPRITTGINEQSMDENAPYPNPFTNELFFPSLQNRQDIMLVLYDATGGKAVLTQNISNGKATIEDLPSGVYLYQLFSNKGDLLGQEKVVKMQ